MLFNSIEYLFFLPLVFFAYRWTCHQTQRKWLLILAGIIFYGYGSLLHLLLLLGIIVTDYLVGKQIAYARVSWLKKSWFVFGVVSNLGVLILFKYINFFYQIISQVTSWQTEPSSHVVWNLVLPVGISFYTFQSIAYLLDVYRGKVQAASDFGDFVLFISFFPQLVAGPIERYAHLAPQLKSLNLPGWQIIEQGLRLILFGFFKKLFIADRLALYTDQVFNFPDLYQGPHILLANFFFTFQIYCDFSGYTDIARGTAKLFGVHLMINFDKPYLSHSFREFWSRWHISLSQWFRDVVYISLGGNREGKTKTLWNLGVVFFLSGLWHGAGFNYILWGCYHGLLVIVERLIKWPFAENKIMQMGKNLLVFGAVSLGWIFFAAGNWQNMLTILKQCAHGWNEPYQHLNILQSNSFMIFAFGGIAGLMAWEIFHQKLMIRIENWAQHPLIRYGWYIFVVQFLAWFGQFSGKQFIYFQF